MIFYFISAIQNWDRWTWVGRIPEHQVFEFKYGPSNSGHENYIVLPLDTQIKWASQLCDIRDEHGNQILDQSKSILWWNPLDQQRKFFNEYACDQIIRRPYPPYDFEMEAGIIYLIFVQRNASWPQI